MKKSLTALIASLGMALSAAAVGWTNVDDDHYVAGRKCSAGYLQGKVVLVCREAGLAGRMEEVWSGFKTKPFVLLGSFAKAPKTVSYPVYSGADLERQAPETPLYVVDETGCIRYRGKDERLATEVVVRTLTDLEAPRDEAQWRRFLDYEIENLPGRAVLRYLELRKQMPAVAKAFATRMEPLVKDAEVKKLVELVRLARAVKDVRSFDPKKAAAQRKTLALKIKDALAKYAPLKESENPKVVQEAKNALADLAWAKAGL